MTQAFMGLAAFTEIGQGKGVCWSGQFPRINPQAHKFQSRQELNKREF
jgi:hypothetical protein